MSNLPAISLEGRVRYRLWRSMAGFFAVLYLAFFAGFLAHNPSYAWDTVAYMSVALRIEGTPDARLHDETYRILDASVPPAWADNLKGVLTPEAIAVGSSTTAMADVGLRQDWAAHSDSFLAELPFFATKPLYPALMALGDAAGLGLITSGLIVSAIAYFLIGTLFFVWFLEWMPPFVALVTMALLVLNPWLVTLARTVGPDILSICLLLYGAYLAMIRRSITSAAIFVASILVRPENIVYAGMFLLYLGVVRQLSVWQTGAFIAGAGLAYIGISLFGGNYGWKTLFYWVFVNREAVPGAAPPPIGTADIVRVYISRIDRILLGQGELPIFLLVGFGALCLKAKRSLYAMLQDQYMQLLILVALTAAARMLVLPTEAFRALLPCYMIVTIIFVIACAQLRLALGGMSGPNAA